METYCNLSINDLGLWRHMVTFPLMIWAYGDYDNLSINDLGLWRHMVTFPLMIWAYGDRL